MRDERRRGRGECLWNALRRLDLLLYRSIRSDDTGDSLYRLVAVRRNSNSAWACDWIEYALLILELTAESGNTQAGMQ